MHDAEEESLATQLRAGPSFKELKRVLMEVERLDLRVPRAGLMELFIILLESTLPTFGTHLEMFVPIFATPVGLQTLCSRLSVPNLPNIQRLLLLDLVEAVLSLPNVVAQLWADNQKEARQLLWGSRLLAASSAASRGTRWFGEVSKYAKWLGDQSVRGDFPSEQIERGAKLGDAPAFIEPWFSSSESISRLASMLGDMRSGGRRFVIAHGIHPLIANAPPPAASGVLDALNIDVMSIADTLCDEPRVLVALAHRQGKIPSLAEYSLNVWADRTNIRHIPEARQRAWAQCCIGCAVASSAAVAKKVTNSPAYIEGVTAHLESASEIMRKFGTIVAEVWAWRAGDSLSFGIGYDESWFLGQDECWSASKSLESIHATWQNGQQEYKPDENEKLNEVLNSSKGVTETVSPLPKLGDSDDEDDEEELAPEPFYVKDLLEYLAANDASKVNSALLHGPHLIRRKAAAGFAPEVDHSAQELLKFTAMLTDRFQLPNFAERRQDLLAATLAVAPTKVTSVIELLGNGDWSLSQRISLLATLALAAADLAAGRNISEIEMLPSAQHRAFVSDIDRLGFEIQQKLVLDSTAESTPGKNTTGTTATNDGQVIRRSARLVAKSAVHNKFASIASSFFLPLAGLYHSIDAGTGYSAVLYAQWLKTLGYLLWLSYPAAPKLGDMAQELVEILMATIEKEQSHEIVIQEAIYACTLYVIDVRPDALDQISATALYAWTGAHWQQAADERTRRLGAAVLIRSGDLAAQTLGFVGT